MVKVCSDVFCGCVHVIMWKWAKNERIEVEYYSSVDWNGGGVRGTVEKNLRDFFQLSNVSDAVRVREGCGPRGLE
eukprot:10114869-Ditylum_brightwellii.AAC.1